MQEPQPPIIEHEDDEHFAAEVRDAGDEAGGDDELAHSALAQFADLQENIGDESEFFWADPAAEDPEATGPVSAPAPNVGRAVEQMPPPPAPPSDPAVARPPRASPDMHEGARGRAAVTVHMPGGCIAFYESKRIFQATCDNKAHGQCKLTRTCNSQAAGSHGAPRGGRPVGFLAAWLAHGEHLGSKADHWERAAMESTRQERLELRQRLGDIPSGRLLLSFERTLHEGEPEEHDDLGVYLR